MSLVGIMLELVNEQNQCCALLTEMNLLYYYYLDVFTLQLQLHE